jgi:periplasmic protein TonB
MNPESILHAEVLDIIFENRNKEYGAYELRTRYAKRLKVAMEIMFLTVITFCLFLWVDAYFFHSSSAKTQVLDFKEINLSPADMRKVPDISKPKTAKQSVTPVKTVAYTNYKIVPLQITKPTPTVDQIDEAQIGTESKSGELPLGNLVLPTANGTATGKDKSPDSAAATIFETSQIMPEFPGGMTALQKYLRNNLHSPEGMEPGRNIKVMEKFVVDERGNISKIRIIQSGGSEFDNEVSRVLKKMPVWRPGKQNGVNVSVYFTIPVIFQGTDEN